MYPKFRYLIVLKPQAPEPAPYQQNSNSSYKKPVPSPAPEKMTVYADGFDIKEDGSIIFYQVQKDPFKEDNKLVKISVLAYPQGKWETCLLLAPDNTFPAFVPDSQGAPFEVQESHSNNSGSSGHSSFSRPPNPSPYSQQDRFSHTTHSNAGRSEENLEVPGFNSAPTVDYQRLKKQYTEVELKNYLANNDKFVLEDFQRHLEVAGRTRPTNPKITLSERDIQFNVSYLIRKKTFAPQKFMEAKKKHILDMYLPPILKRQWDGKTSPIMETLQTSNDTQTITEIDLMAWLALKGGYLK